MNPNARRRPWIAAVGALGVAAAASAGLVLARVETAARPNPPEPVLPVETMAIELEDRFLMQRAFSGRVQPRRESMLGFESGGRLARVAVDEGVSVAAGDLLAELDAERLLARKAELAAALAQAEADLSLADATLKRMRGIVDKGGVSRQELDEAREGRRAAEAAVHLAQQRIASIDVELEKSRLYAPFTGTVVARLADEGRVVETGQPVVTLQENTVPEIRVGIAGPVLDQLVPGRIYHLEWRGRPLSARLRTLLPLRAASARTVDALFDPLDKHAALLPGDIVTLRLTSAVDQAGFWLPMTALAEGDRGLWSIFVADALTDTADGPAGTHHITRRTIDVIHQTSDQVYVRGALEENDEVVVTGLQRIVPGQRVRTGTFVAANRGRRHD